MDATLQRITITPAKFDSEGDIKKQEGVVIAFEAPLNTTGQKEALVELLELLTDEWITFTVTNKQLKLDLAASG